MILFKYRKVEKSWMASEQKRKNNDWSSVSLCIYDYN